MKSKQGKYWDILALSLLALLVGDIFLFNDFLPKSFGTIDYLEYWTAYRLAIEGGNPYSYENMLAFQQQLVPGTAAPTMMWNPPHLLVLLAPLLVHPFPLSAALFAGVSVLALVSTLFYVEKLLQPQANQRARLWILGLTFPATLTCLNIGQLGNILSLALLSGVWCYYRDKKFIAGCLFAICSVKPHLFALVIAIFLLNDLLKRDWRTVFGGCFTVALLCLVTHFSFPGIFEQWIYAIQNPEKFKVLNLINWRPATLIGLFRMNYWRITGLPMPITPMWLFPLLNLAVWVVISIRIGTETVIKKFLPELMIFSALFSPYGWMFDQSFLFLAWAWAFLRLDDLLAPKQLLPLLIMMGAMSLTFMGILYCGLVSESFVGLTLLILLAVRLMRKRAGPHPS